MPLQPLALICTDDERALAMVGDHLLRAGLPELGVAKFKEALLFDGGNPDLQRKAELTPRERQEYAERARRRPGERSAPRTSNEDRAKGLAASLYVAARDGHLFLSVRANDDAFANAATAEDVDLDHCAPAYPRIDKRKQENRSASRPAARSWPTWSALSPLTVPWRDQA